MFTLNLSHTSDVANMLFSSLGTVGCPSSRKHVMFLVSGYVPHQKLPIGNSWKRHKVYLLEPLRCQPASGYSCSISAAFSSPVFLPVRRPVPGNFFYAHVKMADTFPDRLVTNKITLRLANIALQLA